MMGCSKGPDGTWVHTVVGIQTAATSGEIAVAHFHCHAPTCLSMSIANNETGEVCGEHLVDRAHVGWPDALLFATD